MQTLIKKSVRSYASRIESGTIYAYEAARQDATRVNMPSPEQIKKLNKMKAIHEEPRRQVAVMAAAAAIVGLAGGPAVAASAGLIAGLAGISSHCQNCHK